MKKASLHLKKIVKSFYGKQLFNHLSYEFNPGIYAILGKNGIGKSTLLSMMAGSLTSDSGNILINGLDIQTKSVAAKNQLAYVPDKTMIYPFVTGVEFINLITSIKKPADTSELKILLEEFNLTPYLHLSFGNMSLGTQRKFMIAAASIGHPSVVLMDEPSNALETAARQTLINYLQKHAQHKVLILATHDQELITSLNAKKLCLQHPPIAAFKEDPVL